MEIGGVKLRFLKSEIDGITGEMELISTRLSARIIERTKKENEQKKQIRAIESAQQEIAESENDVVSSEQELRQQNSEVSQIEDELESIRVEIEQRDDGLNEIKNTAKEKRELVDKTLSAEIELVNTIEQHEKSIKDYERSLQHYLKEIRELKLHTIANIPEIKLTTGTTHSEDHQEGEDEEDEEPHQDYTELIEYPVDELQEFNAKTLEQEIENLASELEDANIDMEIINDYCRRAQEYNSRCDDVNEAVSRRDGMKNYCESLRKRRLDEFLEGFNLISMKLKEMYQMITMGGNAELELVDSLDPFSEGILFSVMPPKKSWKNISNLSGGEKTLSSLALVFALHHYKPTPLYVMDEIDAALDFRNVSIVANYIKERTKNGQFIVISLRNNMFELASQLVGIYKVNNMTKSVAIKNKDHNQEQQQRQQQQQQKQQHHFSHTQQQTMV